MAQTTGPVSIPQFFVSGDAQTPAQMRLDSAIKNAADNPQRAEQQAALAEALIVRHRENNDPALLDRAEKSIAEALRLDPKNYVACRAEIGDYLARREYGKAKALADQLNKLNPDDLDVTAELIDASIGLGEYHNAEVATQYIMDVRPGNSSGLERAAELRELFGDPEGAFEFFQIVDEKCDPSEVSHKAWIEAHTAHAELLMGRPDLAIASARSALNEYATSEDALLSMAQALTARRDDAPAADALRRLVELTPRASYCYTLALADERCGKTDEAKTLFEKFEKLALSQVEQPDNANKELVYYYCDHAHNPAEALRIAKVEMAARHDIATSAAYAWALHANGDLAGAKIRMTDALAVGYRDSMLLNEAGIIAHDAGDTAFALKAWGRALTFGPALGVAPAAWAQMLQATGTSDTHQHH